MKIGLSDEAATTAVEQGRLDYAPFLPADRIDEVATRYAAQLHNNPYPQTNYLQLNTRIAPFDKRDARRALSYAIDRNELIRLAGGPRVKETSCQILPPNFPGYQRYCPYTLHPTSAGTWRAPDLARARTLITRSGTRGMHVTVMSHIGSDWEGTAAYVVRLLNRLGYKASRTALPPNAFLPHTFLGSRRAAQIFVAAWAADYPSAGAFIKPALSCNADQNDSGFCNPRVDGEMRRAENLQPTDPRAANAQWAHIDRELVDAAPWIPTSSARSLDFVSKRVGNFQFHPQWLVLFDQLWVR